LLLAIDGNSLLHRAHHAMEQSALRDSEGRPIWALKGLISFIATAAARLTPDAIVIGFDSPGDSVRKVDYPDYKAHRLEKPPDLRLQLDDAPALLAAAGITVVVPAGYEADDVLATSAALARRHNWRTAVVTSDRDSFALIDESTSVLRVLNGGIDGSPLLTPDKMTAVCGVSADRYRDYAALRGDSSDNLPGALGIGAKTALAGQRTVSKGDARNTTMLDPPAIDAPGPLGPGSGAVAHSPCTLAGRRRLNSAIFHGPEM
jgi:DNA polymerase-1